MPLRVALTPWLALYGLNTPKDATGGGGEVFVLDRGLLRSAASTVSTLYLVIDCSVLLLISAQGWFVVRKSGEGEWVFCFEGR